MLHLQLKLAIFLAWAAAVASQDLSSPDYEARGNYPAGVVNYTQLAEKLSSTSQIYLPGSEPFDSTVARWSNLSTPVANVVIIPSTEHDIIETVRLPSTPHECPVTAYLSSHGLG
jgi:hypothetical protein